LFEFDHFVSTSLDLATIIFSQSKVICVEEGEIGGLCSPNGEKRNAYRLLWESQRERDH
jgi:hypothetical protein